MKVIINLTPDEKKTQWPRFTKTLFRKYQSVIRMMLPVEYKGQAKLITQRAFDPVWVPLIRLSETVLVFEFNNDDVNDETLKCTVPRHAVNAKLNQTLKHLHGEIHDHTVVLMGLPFVSYTTEVKEAFYAYLEKELRTFVDQLWDEALENVNLVAIQFTKK